MVEISPRSTQTNWVFYNRKIAYIFLAWSAIILILLVIHLHYQYQHTISLARIQALESYNKDVTYRHWAALHGGVYVPITEHTPPNPYLSHLERRDETTLSGQQLTLVNPAYMTRQVHELSHEIYGVKGHITSLNPLRPENAPDPWEQQALNRFEHGDKEVYELINTDEGDALKLMRPLYVKQSCLKCHEQQGYSLGEVRGGISVTVPMQPFWAIFSQQVMTTSAIYLFIWFLVSLGLINIIKRRQGYLWVGGLEYFHKCVDYAFCLFSWCELF